MRKKASSSAKTEIFSPSQALILAALQKCGRRANRGFFSPISAIRDKCKDCAGGNLKSVRECDLVQCPLWVHRLGTGRQSDAMQMPLTVEQRRNWKHWQGGQYERSSLS